MTGARKGRRRSVPWKEGSERGACRGPRRPLAPPARARGRSPTVGCGRGPGRLTSLTLRAPTPQRPARRRPQNNSPIWSKTETFPQLQTRDSRLPDASKGRARGAIAQGAPANTAIGSPSRPGGGLGPRRDPPPENPPCAPPTLPARAPHPRARARPAEPPGRRGRWRRGRARGGREGPRRGALGWARAARAAPGPGGAASARPAPPRAPPLPARPCPAPRSPGMARAPRRCLDELSAARRRSGRA